MCVGFMSKNAYVNKIFPMSVPASETSDPTLPKGGDPRTFPDCMTLSVVESALGYIVISDVKCDSLKL